MYQAIGPHLAPCRWTADGCPHAEYLRRAASLGTDRALYSLEVWRNEGFAREEIRRFGRADRVYLLMRIPRVVVARSALQCVTDDWVDGKGLLLFEEGAAIPGQVYGQTRLPWAEIGSADPSWTPLADYHEEDLRAVGHPRPVAPAEPRYFPEGAQLPMADHRPSRLLRGRRAAQAALTRLLRLWTGFFRRSPGPANAGGLRRDNGAPLSDHP